MDMQTRWNLASYFFGMATVFAAILGVLVTKAYRDYKKSCREFEEVDKHFDRRG